MEKINFHIDFLLLGWEELNLKEIGLVMGVSESRVSQIHGQALARLRSKVDVWAS